MLWTGYYSEQSLNALLSRHLILAPLYPCGRLLITLLTRPIRDSLLFRCSFFIPILSHNHFLIALPHCIILMYRAVCSTTIHARHARRFLLPTVTCSAYVCLQYESSSDSQRVL